MLPILPRSETSVSLLTVWLFATASCQAGYFCAHEDDESTVCCAEGSSLEECAKLNGAKALKSDEEAEEEPSESSAVSAPASSSASDSATKPTETAEDGEDDDEPEAEPEEPESGAASVVPGLALVAGVVACLL